MSQVIKKLQSGGSITIDGIKYNATPEFINALTDHIGSVAGTDAQTLAGLTNALQNGENLTYNSASNTITGMNGLWGGITDRQNENRRANTSRWRKFWDAQFDTDAHRFRNALTAIGTFHWQPNDKTENEATNLKDIYGDKTWYKYDVDKDGNKTWLDNAGENIAIAQRLADVTSYLKDPEAGKKTYRLGSWYTPDRVAALQGLYGKYTPETWQAGLDAIAERAKSNTLSAEDRAFLANFNIVEPDEATATTSGSGLSAADRTKWNNAGHGGLADLLGGRAHINDDGSISLNEGESWGWNLGDLEGRNIWFNDDFFNSRYGADGSFDPYRNYTLYNNRLYALDNPTLARILNADGGFNAMMKSGNWTGADNQILTRFTDLARENPAYLNPDQYSTFLSANPNYRFSDLTGLATTNGMTDDQQLIQYVNLGDDSLEGPYRRYNYKYALLNNRGDLERELTPEEVIRLENGQARETGLNTYKRTVGRNNGAYNNRYYEDILDKNGQVTGFRFYRSIDNPDQDVILHMPQIYANGVDNQDLVLPKEVAQVLMNNPNWLNNVVGNAQNKKNFMKILSSLVQSGWGQSDTLWYRNEAAQLRKMGFSQSQIEQFLQAFNKARKGSRAQRRDDMLVIAPQFEKNGGVLKDQKGGIAGGAKTATAVTEKRVNTTNTNPKNAAGVSEIGGKNWTDADTADMVALAADLGSLTTAFVPGANIASVATGAAGSTARLYADLSRGTKGAIPNYLLNLGMDATMLLPILGGAGKIARIPNAVKKALPTIVKAASVYGLGAGVVETAKKIASGQKFTTRDVDMLVNTITAGVGIGKSGGFGRKTKKVSGFVGEEPTIKFKAGENGAKPEGVIENFKLDRTKLSNVDTPESFKKAVVDAAKNAGDNVVTLENVADRYDLSAFISNNGKSWSPSWNPKTWFKTNKTGVEKLDSKALNMKTKGRRVAFTPEDIAEMSAFERWHRGLTGYNQMYNKTLLGENPGSFTTIRKTISVPNTVKVGQKQIKFSKSEQQLLQDTPVMQQFDKFKELAKSKSSSLTDADLETAFRGLLIENPKRFDIVFNGDVTTSITGQKPTWYRGRTEGLSRVTNQEGVTTTTRRRLYDTNMGIALPQWINPFTIANYQGYEDQQPSGAVMQPLFKKGGKIVRAQEGDELQKYLDDRQDAINLDLISNRKTNYTPTTDTSQGTFSVQKYNPDLNVPLNWARSLYAMKQSDKQLNNFLNRPKYQMQGPILNAPRYINTGTGNAYRVQADNTRMSKPVTSDAMQNDLMQRSRQQEARQLELQGALADSQEYGQYKAGLDEFNNNNILRNTEIANQNGQLRWQHGIEDVQAKNANIAEKSKFFDQAAYATQDWYNRNYQTMQGLEGSQAYTQKLGDLDKWYRNERLAIEKRKLEGDVLAQELASLNTRLALKKQELGYDNLYWNLSPSFRNRIDRNIRIAKSGTKISSEGKRSAVTYSKDPYPELLLQNSKDSAQAVKQLNDAIIKLLLQTKPINVH